jgi:hypothetical protein
VYTLADRLDDMRITATVDGGAVTATLTRRTRLHLEFAPGAYRRRSEAQLQRDLAVLASRLWANRMRGYYQALSDITGQHVTGEPPARDDRSRAYRAGRAELIAYGESADGRIRVQVRGMRDWQVTIASGTVRALTEHEFAARVAEVGQALLDDLRTKIRQLKRQAFGARSPG